MQVHSITTHNINFLSKHVNEVFGDYFDRLEENNNIHSFVQYEDEGSVLREKLRAHMLERFMTVKTDESDSVVKYASCLEDTNIKNLQNRIFVLLEV